MEMWARACREDTASAAFRSGSNSGWGRPRRDAPVRYCARPWLDWPVGL